MRLEAERGYQSTAGHDPTKFYEEVSSLGGVVWDDSVSGWLVTSHAHVSEVLQNEGLYKTTDWQRPAGTALVRGTGRRLETVTGRDLERLHNIMIRPLDPRTCELHRVNTVGPILNSELRRMRDRNAWELGGNFCEVLPMRIGCALLGLGDDEDLIAKVRELHKPIRRWMDSLGDDADVVAEAARAFAGVREMFMPTVLQCRDNRRDDIISKMWELGLATFSDWNEEDTFLSCWDHYFGGEIPSLLRNMIHGLLVEPAMREKVISTPEPYLAHYVEESVRVTGVVHWQIRVVAEDCVLGEQAIARGDKVFALIAAANRDGSHFKCPHTINLDSAPPKDHVGFGRGPRYCAGRHLVRVEAYEAVLGIFRAFPRMSLDANCPPPVLSGFHARSYAPLHVSVT